MSSVNDELRADLFFFFQVDISIPEGMDHQCKNNADMFYYISGNVVLPDHQAKITDFLKKAYNEYFGVKLEKQTRW